MMRYEEFLNQVKESIRDYLPVSDRNAEILIQSQLKNNDQLLDALVIKTEDMKTTPMIYLNPMYEDMKGGESLHSILDKIADAWRETRNQKIDISWINDLEIAKDRIMYRLINLGRNAEYLADKPYKRIDDLAAVYTMEVDRDRSGIMSVTITNDIMKKYGITQEELDGIAAKNTEKMSYTFKHMGSMIQEMLFDTNPIDMGLMEHKLPLYILSNETSIFGAAAILNEKARQEIHDQIGDYYIIPSSVHEILAIPKYVTPDYRDVEKMIQEVNQNAVSEADRLSDHVYEYDPVGKSIIRSERLEAREQAKEKKTSLKEQLEEKKTQIAQAPKNQRNEKGRDLMDL